MASFRIFSFFPPLLNTAPESASPSRFVRYRGGRRREEKLQLAVVRVLLSPSTSHRRQKKKGSTEKSSPRTIQDCNWKHLEANQWEIENNLGFFLENYKTLLLPSGQNKRFEFMCLVYIIHQSAMLTRRMLESPKHPTWAMSFADDVTFYLHCVRVTSCLRPVSSLPENLSARLWVFWKTQLLLLVSEAFQR